MSESPYAIPVEDLVESVRVPLAAQVEEQPERRFFGGDPDNGPLWCDDAAADADGA
jgi:hypothetical protein